MPATPWRLVWSDEFDAPGAPDPAKWAFEIGMLRNYEPQFYTSRPENARVENGFLVIEARREAFPNPWFDPTSGGWPTNQRVVEFTSANLVSRGKANWTFGRIESRAKVPRGSGVWPAIWMLGLDYESVGWPACGEIDIMEYVGQEPSHLHQTIHFLRDNAPDKLTNAATLDDPADGFHDYACEWTPDRITFFIDQEPRHHIDLTTLGESAKPFHRPFYLQLNLALGGWGGPIDPSTNSWQFLIDFVRVYQRDEST